MFAAIYERAAQRLLDGTTFDASLPIAEQAGAALDAYLEYFAANADTVPTANVVLADDRWVQRITDKRGAPVCFCDSRSPWQRGTNENTNGLLRDYFPKGVSLTNYIPAHLLAVEHELNHRPNEVLQGRCHAGLFTAL